MRRWLFGSRTLALVVCLFVPAAVHGEGDAAFPGAEGFGGSVKGGSGGKEIWVTTLDSDGPGSLREAIDTPGPRIIKFKVAGTIELERRPLHIGAPFRATYKKLTDEGKPADQIENPYSFVTIEGASAPPPGITISGNLSIGGYGAKQAIVRNLRIRDNGFVGRSGADCVCIMGSHVLIDHCSLQWARDEVVNPWYAEAHDITVQWCIIGPGWGPHGYGFVNGSGTDRITLHHNLFPHNHGRNPLICGNSRDNWIGKFANDTPILDCRNNVAYNWVYEAATITAGAHVNIVGSLFIPGLDSSTTYPVIRATCNYHTKPTVLYLKGNRSPRRPKDDMDEWADAGTIATVEGKGYQPAFGPHEWGQKSDTPFPAPPVATHSAVEAKALVLSQAGAWPRDAIDAGIIRTVLQGTGYVAADNAMPSDFTNAKPTAAAAASPAEGGDPLIVTFQAEAGDKDGKVAWCTWDFGDGQRAVGERATHRYPAPGTYAATLFVTDGQGAGGTASLHIVVGKDAFKAERVAPAASAEALAPSKTTQWQPPTVALPAALPAPPTDEQWNAAPRLMPFVDQATWKKTPEGKVDARMICDRENLYVRMICDGFPADTVKAVDAFASPERDWRESRSHNGVILFFSPHYGETTWYRFDIGTNARRYDAKQGDRGWNASPDWRIQSKAANSKWTLTVAIPLAAVEAKAEKGQCWGLKLIVGTEKDDLCIWPPVGSAGPDLFCVPETPNPIYYAKLQLP